MSTKIIKGTDPHVDIQKLREAIADPDVMEIVIQGTLDLGGLEPAYMPDPEPRATVVIPRGITIRGDSARSAIIGGSARVSVIVGTVPIQMSGGALRVENLGPGAGGDDQPVVIKDLVFHDWAGAAILVTACRGLVIEGCQFTHPVPVLWNEIDAMCVYGVLAVGERCTGDITLTGNTCDLHEYAWMPLRKVEKEPRPRPRRRWPFAEDEQFAAILGTKFRAVVVTGNEIIGNDDGVEVLYNDASGAESSIKIAGNHMDLAHSLHTQWPGSTGVVCVGNGVTRTEISGNMIVTTGSWGTAMLLSGTHLTVQGNTSRQEASPGARHLFGIVIGSNYPTKFPPGTFPPYAGCVYGSSIVDNTLVGTACVGIVSFDIKDMSREIDGVNATDLGLSPAQVAAAPPVDSSGNTIANNHLRAFACVTQLHLTSATHDNVVTGGFATWHDDDTNATSGIVSLAPSAPPPGVVGPEVSSPLPPLGPH